MQNAVAPRGQEAHCLPVQASELEAWARKVNNRWLVRSDLKMQTNDYLDHLALVDRKRLQSSCWMARHLLESLGQLEDPKPRFYSGIFSLATRAEAQQYLHEHLFTLSLIPAGMHLHHLDEETLSGHTEVSKLREEIRKGIRALRDIPTK